MEISVDSAPQCTQNVTLTKLIHVNKVLQVPSLHDHFQFQQRRETPHCRASSLYPCMWKCHLGLNGRSSRWKPSCGELDTSSIPGSRWREHWESARRSTMDTSEPDAMRSLAAQNVCPNCGKTIPQGKRHVYGDGVFCSLDCVAVYNAVGLVERHKRLLEATKRHQNS